MIMDLNFAVVDTILGLVNATTNIFCFKSDHCSYQYKYVATDDFNPSFTNDINSF